MPNPDWGRIRELFPVCRNWSYLNNAYVAPPSSLAVDAMHQSAQKMSLHGEACLDECVRPIHRCRQLAAQLINATATEIAILKNTSECLATIAEGLDWRMHDNVVIVEGDYPANVYPWMQTGDHGVEVRMVPWRDHRVRVDDIAARIDRHTRVVALSYVQYTNGFRHDLTRIEPLCKEQGALICLDAIQAVGVIPIDVQQMGVDMLAAGTHKWLAAPMGTALLYVRQDLIPQIRPIEVGWKSVVNAMDFSSIDFRLRSNAGRFECGTLPLANIAALAVNLEMWTDLGTSVVAARLRELSDLVVERVKWIGGDVVSPRENAHWSPIVAFQLSGVDPDAAVDHCRRRGVVICQRDGLLRASPHVYNDESDIERLVQALAAMTL